MIQGKLNILKKVSTMNLSEAIENCSEIYQNIIIDGMLIRKGKRTCEDRAKVILDTVEDKDSVLDIGANFGYFGHKILSEKKKCCYLGIEREYSSTIIASHVLKKYVGALFMCGNINFELLKALDDSCENVDTLLLMSILHHFPIRDFVGICQIFDRMSRKVVIELAPENDCNACGQKVIKDVFGKFKSQLDALTVLFPSKAFHLAGEAESHVTQVKRKIFVGIQIDGVKRYHKNARDPFIGKNHNARKYVIEGDKMLKKNIYTDYEEIVRLIPGFLLWNWSTFGKYMLPSQQEAQKQAKKYFERISLGSSDVRPWNILWTARGLRYIDITSKKEADYCTLRPTDIDPILIWLKTVFTEFQEESSQCTYL